MIKIGRDFSVYYSKNNTSSGLNPYSRYYNIWVQRGKNSSKLSLKEMDYTLTPDNLWATVRSALVSMADAGKSSLLDMNYLEIN